MNTLVFSDVHLKVGPEARPVRDEFSRFLRTVDTERFDRIVILGDLFDFWFEYKHVIFSGYFEVLRAFAELRDRGVEIHLVCGNHDFWAGRFLEDELGIHVHPDAYDCDLGEVRALFVHGDGINAEDRTYRRYKRFARWRPVVRLFRAIHPDWAMRIAQRVSHGSRTYLNSSDPAEGQEVQALRAFARDAIANGDANFVLCGHSHYAETCEFPGPAGSGGYINTGDWAKCKTYAEWDGTAFRLRVYENGDWESAALFSPADRAPQTQHQTPLQSQEATGA